METVQQILRVLRNQQSAKLSMGGIDRGNLKAPVPPYVAGIPGYIASYADTKTLLNQCHFYATVLNPIIDNLQGSIGADVGCWFGVPSYLLTTVGPAKVIGFDIDDEFVRICRTWKNELAIDEVDFFNINTLSDRFAGTFDWVLINQVLCNALPDSFGKTLEMSCAALKPGGKVVVCDSNNPWCADTRDRLLRQFEILELGDGTVARPDGEFFRLRKKMISERFIHLEEARADFLAAGTCYKWGPEIMDFCERSLAGIAVAASAFQADWQRSPVEPYTGAASGNITDPHTIAAQLTDLGMDAYITTSTAVPRSDQDAVKAMLENSQGFYVIGKTRHTL